MCLFKVYVFCKGPQPEISLKRDVLSMPKLREVAYPVRTVGFDAEQLNLEFPNTVGPFAGPRAQKRARAPEASGPEGHRAAN